MICAGRRRIQGNEAVSSMVFRMILPIPRLFSIHDKEKALFEHVFFWINSQSFSPFAAASGKIHSVQHAPFRLQPLGVWHSPAHEYAYNH